MKLKYIYRGDFRKSELTLFNEVQNEVPQMRFSQTDPGAAASPGTAFAIIQPGITTTSVSTRHTVGNFGTRTPHFFAFCRYCRRQPRSRYQTGVCSSRAMVLQRVSSQRSRVNLSRARLPLLRFAEPFAWRSSRNPGYDIHRKLSPVSL